MNPALQKLCQAAAKPERLVLGLMSGTSLDGLDLALCRCTGAGRATRVTLLHFKSVPYTEAFKTQVRAVFAQKTVDLQFFALLNVLIANRHAAIVLDCLQEWGVAPETVDVLASHGQTVMHAPRILHGLADMPNATLQIGDGDHLARRTGILTISDFRQKHVAAGGEGAPLALYGDYFLFSDDREDRALLNIGGIANFTWLPADGNTEHVTATDTGPGNTLLDAFARQLFGVDYDKDGLLARAGSVNPFLLEMLLQAPFFEQKLPKTTGPELFNLPWVQTVLDQLPKGFNNPYDIMATLARLTVDSIVRALLQMPRSAGAAAAVYVSGGGAFNPVLMDGLAAALPGWSVHTIDALGIPADAKEAVLFAILANETLAAGYGPSDRLAGLPLVTMGKISLP